MAATLFQQPLFDGFGPRLLAPAAQPPPLRGIAAPTTRRLRSELRELCPTCPGVYGMLDADGHLIYVGKAKRLRTRLFSYFHKGGDRKARRIVSRAKTIVWEAAPSEFAALLRELELIRRWQPRFNVQGLPLRRRRTYVCVGGRPAPYAYVSRRPGKDVLSSFGPVPAGPQARAATRWLNDVYQLRDCPQVQRMVFADQTELFPIDLSAGCLRLEIGTCLGPCAGVCTRSAYQQRVRSARRFLAGQHDEPIQQLTAAMNQAAQEQAYERAATLRDKQQGLTWLAAQLARLRSLRASHSFVYPLTGTDGETICYLIHGGQVRLAAREPKTATARKNLERQTKAIFAERPSDAFDVDALDTIFLVAGWFRKYPEEREKCRPGFLCVSE